MTKIKNVRLNAGTESSSEVGSDEDNSDHLCYGLDDGTPMEMDIGVDEPMEAWNPDEEYAAAAFTSAPSCIDLGSAVLPLVDNSEGSAIVAEEYSGAAEIVEESSNLYAQIWEADELHEDRSVAGPYYPFSGCMEWEVVEWLHSLRVPMDKIDQFFDLSYVSQSFIFIVWF